jgi:hypothetical protein
MITSSHQLSLPISLPHVRPPSSKASPPIDDVRLGESAVEPFGETLGRAIIEVAIAQQKADYPTPPEPADASPVWAPDAVLAPPLGYEPEPETGDEDSFSNTLGAAIIAVAIAQREADYPTSASLPENNPVWAPDAVLTGPIAWLA